MFIKEKNVGSVIRKKLSKKNCFKELRIKIGLNLVLSSFDNF